MVFLGFWGPELVWVGSFRFRVLRRGASSFGTSEGLGSRVTRLDAIKSTLLVVLVLLIIILIIVIAIIIVIVVVIVIVPFERNLHRV